VDAIVAKHVPGVIAHVTLPTPPALRNSASFEIVSQIEGWSAVSAPTHWRHATDIALDIDHREWKLAEKMRQHRAFLIARLLLVTLFLGLWLALLPPGYRMPYGFLITLLAEFATLLVFFRAMSKAAREETLERLHYGLVLCELGFHTAMVYFLGGLSWLGPVAYLYALLYAVVFFTRFQAAVFTVMVSAAFVLIVSLDGAGVLPHQWYLPQDANRFQDPAFVIPTTVAFIGVVSTIAFWMLFIGSELRRETEAALRANADLVKAQEELRRLNDDLERKVEERTRVLAFRAEHDQLTGLFNRGAVQRKCLELLALARRGGRPLATIVADVDMFKACNDLGGHAYGDRVLRVLGDCLDKSARETDFVGRIGGDEFLIVLPDTSEDGATRFCRRALRRLDRKRSAWNEDDLPLPSVSMGIAVFPDHGSDLDELVRVADHAMYRAKADGGGRSLVGSDEDQARVPRSRESATSSSKPN
jgi:diguanylate cyclase (GGDEF)-like protein